MIPAAVPGSPLQPPAAQSDLPAAPWRAELESADDRSTINAFVILASGPILRDWEELVADCKGQHGDWDVYPLVDKASPVAPLLQAVRRRLASGGEAIALRLAARRQSEPMTTGSQLVIGPVTVRPMQKPAAPPDSELLLSPCEFGILQTMAREPGQVFSRAELIRQLRGDNYPVTERSVDVHIATIRRKLGEWGKTIETVRGVGYRFVRESGIGGRESGVGK